MEVPSRRDLSGCATACHRDSEFLFGHVGWVLADDTTLVHDEDPVRKSKDLLQFERDEQNRLSAVAGVDELPVHELDRPHVEATRGLSGEEHLRIAADLASQH